MIAKKKLIAVVDDERDILELIEIHLEAAGYAVETFEDVLSFYQFLKKRIPDLVVLDLMLPGYDGLDVCKDLLGERRYKYIPLIMVTAKGTETDRVLGLELGADDYVTKPFAPRELVARVKSLLRRTQLAAVIEEKDVLNIEGELVIDLKRYEVSRKGKKLDLTITEFKIITMFAQRPGIVFSRDEVLNHLWGDDKAVLDRTIDVHIRNLREKLGASGKFVKNVRGVGYKLDT